MNEDNVITPFIGVCSSGFSSAVCSSFMGLSSFLVNNITSDIYFINHMLLLSVILFNIEE